MKAYLSTAMIANKKGWDAHFMIFPKSRMDPPAPWFQ